MVYTPKKKRKLHLKIIIPLLLAMIVIAVFGVSKLIKQEDNEKKYQVCGYSHQKTEKILSKKYTNPYVVSDYLFYGESLNILKDDYDIEKNDALSGKTVVLKDICSDQKYSYVFGASIDRKLLIDNIETGYYELFVIEDYVEKRIVFDESIRKGSFNTILRDGKRLRADLIADSLFYQKEDIKQDQEYAFLQVYETKIANNEYDMILDPSAYDYDFTYLLNKGVEGNHLIEGDESYKAAVLLKEKLEKRGLKVLVVRKDKEELNSYGKKGRLEKAYHAKAKYYFRLGFNKGAEDHRGMNIIYSSHASNYLASQIIYNIKKISTMEINSLYGNELGVVKTTLLEGQLDKRAVYDDDLWIRESGGKATQAGMYSKNAQEGTSYFAKDNLFGMNTLNITLGYLTNQKDVAYWLEHKDEYMEALAKSILISLKIEE